MPNSVINAKTDGLRTTGGDAATLDLQISDSTVTSINSTGITVTGTATATTFSGSGASLTSLNASSISSGTLANARTTATDANGASTIVARDASGNFTGATITATTFSGSGSSLTSLNASSISTGTVATARLASGTANSTTFLRGDQTWAVVTSGLTVSNDTSTSSDLYPSFANVTTGTITTVFTSNTKLLYKPSTGELKATVPVASNGIFVNSNTVTSDYTIASGFNGVSGGPVTVASGVAVTVTSGSVWTVA